MSKKYFIAEIAGIKLKILFTDLSLICKRKKKIRPAVPKYEKKQWGKV
jgi:hypothetical protein